MYNTFLIFILTTTVAMATERTLGSLDVERNSGIIQLCGFRSEDHSLGFNRIVGGKDAEKNEFKWQVSIRLKYDKKLHHMCGGTIIGESWVLTAAHCTVDFTKEELVFVAGDHLLNSKDGTEQYRMADLFIVHEDYDSLSQKNDIALVRLKKPYDFSTFKVAPACLPDHKQNFSGNCVVTGWGKNREGGKNTNVLQKVWLPIIEDDLCRVRMTKIGYGKLISETMICAGYDVGGKDACQGDSGGPLVCPGKSDMPILVGIVSWGIGCARKNIPGIYTEVSYFIEWINDKVKKNSPTSTNRGPFSDTTKIGLDLEVHQQPNGQVQGGMNPFVHIQGGFHAPPTPLGSKILGEGPVVNIFHHQGIVPGFPVLVHTNFYPSGQAKLVHGVAVPHRQIILDRSLEDSQENSSEEKR